MLQRFSYGSSSVGRGSASFFQVVAHPNIWLLIIISLSLGRSVTIGQVPHFVSQNFFARADILVTSMIQDNQGVVWLGTEEGLFRYDGISYKRYVLQDSTQWHVSALGYRENSGLWVGMASGEIYFVNARDEVVPWLPEEGLPNQSITGILEDSTGRLWFSTYGEGVYVYDKDRLYNLSMQDGLIENQIYCMSLDALGQIWLATDNGVSICRFEGRKKYVRNLNVSDGLLDEIVYSLYADKTGMWIGFHSHGFCHYNLNRDTIDMAVSTWDLGPVRSLRPHLSSKIWIGTEMGLYVNNRIQDGLQSDHFAQINTFKDQSCDHIMVDRQGNLWTVIDRNLIFCSSPTVELFHHQKGDIQAILQDGQGVVWTGTQAGLFKLRDGNLEDNRWPGENIISLYEDQYQRIWIGTFGDGVICWDPRTGHTSRLTERDGMANGSVLSIDGFEDNLWLATLGGIVQIHNHRHFPEEGRIQFSNLIDRAGLSGKFFYKVFVDVEGNVWFGTDGQGLIKMTDTAVTSFLDEDLLPAKTIYTIAQDANRNIWLGTGGDGVYIYQDGRYQHLGRSTGLRNSDISSIAIDALGDVLMVHGEGIDIYDSKSRTIRYLDENVGVYDLNPSLNSVATGDDRSIWIGGTNQIVRYYSDPNKSQPYPHLLFDQIWMYDGAIDYLNEQLFQYRNNFIEFHFMALWYSDPKDLRYQYRLNGYDLGWKITGDRRVSYSKLAPGSYNFEVRSLLQDQVIAPSQINYAFKIKPPYWLQLWFLISLAICVSASIYFYQRYRERLINRNAASDRERIESQYEVLKAQINPHFLFNSFNTLASIVEEDADLAIEYIEKLSDYYRSIIQFRNLKLISLDEELILINDFIYLLKKRFGNNLIVQQEVSNRDLFIPPLTLQMLVENAVKHNVISARKPLRISIKSQNDDYIVVRNNLQPKKTHEPSTKFGLQNIKSRVELLSSHKVVIDQQADYFEVRIPLIKSPQR